VVEIKEKDGNVALSQKQFFVGPHKDSTRLWPIPLNATDPQFPTIFDTRDVVLHIPFATPFRLNSGDTAHFITSYDEVHLAFLLESVRKGNLSVIDRLQLLDESTLLARGGMMPSVQLLDIVSAYENETSEPVWNIIFAVLAELRKFVEFDTTAEKKLRELSGKMAKNIYDKLGWKIIEGESDDDTKLRATAISLTLYSEDRNAIEIAKKIYNETALEALDPELRGLILSTNVRYGDAKIVDDLLKAYVNTASGELKQDICAGITSTRVPEKIDELLSAIKNADIVRPQDVARWFVYLIRGKESRDKAWQWIRDNWFWIVETFGGDKSYDDYPRYSASAMMTDKQLKEYTEFFIPKKKITALNRVITMGVSEIEGRVALIQNDGPAVIAALKTL
jgi:aminopeptidase N